jgi:hypothetical protein
MKQCLIKYRERKKSKKSPFVVCRGPEIEAGSFSGRGDLRILEPCLADTVQENSGR